MKSFFFRGEAWISGILCAEPGGEWNTLPDKGALRDEILKGTPLSNRWSWARWLGERQRAPRCWLRQWSSEERVHLSTLHPIYPLGEHRPAWQLFSLGSFPGTVWGKWAINPMPGPALAQNQVGECVWVVLDVLMFIIHLQPRALYKMSLNPNKHLLYLPPSLFSLPPFPFLSPKTFTPSSILQITSIPSCWNRPLAATIYIKYWAPLENCFNCDNYTWKDRLSP